MLCLRPESWAEAARYRTTATLIPLICAVFLGAMLMSWFNMRHIREALTTFAAGYEANKYPALELHSSGTLTAQGPLPSPIRMELPEALILIDPTGTTSPDSVKTPAIFITGDEVYVTSSDGPVKWTSTQSLAALLMVNLPPAGQTKVINGASISDLVQKRGGFYQVMSVPASIFIGLGEAIWGALMILLVAPLVVITAGSFSADSENAQRRLILPRRAAIRMCMAFLVPVFVLDGILRATGHGLSQAVGGVGVFGVGHVFEMRDSAVTGVERLVFDLDRFEEALRAVEG